MPALKGDALRSLQQKLPEWDVIDEHHLRRTFSFPDFASALGFVNRVGEVAENEGHHPDISFTWGRATIEVFTHAIDGLTESDFVLAAKINRVM
ncbi:MAG: 4a-hydroxytetrahydrobiopterin dehydratase [Myxococcota bacterium]